VKCHTAKKRPENFDCGGFKTFYLKSNFRMWVSTLNLSEEKTRKVAQALEEIAKSNVVEIQGQYYETFD
jgi:hypothetical protein